MNINWTLSLNEIVGFIVAVIAVAVAIGMWKQRITGLDNETATIKSDLRSFITQTSQALDSVNKSLIMISGHQKDSKAAAEELYIAVDGRLTKLLEITEQAGRSAGRSEALAEAAATTLAATEACRAALDVAARAVHRSEALAEATERILATHGILEANARTLGRAEGVAAVVDGGDISDAAKASLKAVAAVAAVKKKAEEVAAAAANAAAAVVEHVEVKKGDTA